jgi:hypothetical protein
MASVGISHNGCATIGTLRPSQHDIPRDFAQYAIVGEIDAGVGAKFAKSGEPVFLYRRMYVLLDGLLL